MHVQSMDDSYFGKPNCFQLAHSKSHQFHQFQQKHRKNSGGAGSVPNSNSNLSSSAVNTRFQLSSSVSMFSWFPGSEQSEPVDLFESISSATEEYFLFAESAVEKEEWLHLLRQLCYCCELCANTYGYKIFGDQKSKEHMLNKEKSWPKKELIVTRRLHVWVMEAKDIILNVPQRNYQKSNPEFSQISDLGSQIYGVLVINNMKQAKLSTKSINDAFWGEDFTFIQISP
ncbi:hypothetical protein HK096_009587, partial [Nowakowskiella sp. JEL0078]